MKLPAGSFCFFKERIFKKNCLYLLSLKMYCARLYIQNQKEMSMSAALELLNYGKKKVADYAHIKFDDVNKKARIVLNDDFFKLFENDNVEILGIMMNTIFYRYSTQYHDWSVNFDKETHEAYMNALNKNKKVKFEKNKLLMISFFQDGFRTAAIDDMKESVQLVRDFIEQMEK